MLGGGIDPMNIPITLVKLFEDVTLSKHPHIWPLAYTLEDLTSGTYETAIFCKGKWSEQNLHEDMFQPFIFRGVYSEFDFLAPRNQLFFSQFQIPQRRGEERSGNFVGVGGHTNVGINDGPKKENLWQRRVNLGVIWSWKRFVKVVTATLVNAWPGFSQPPCEIYEWAYFFTIGFP